MAVERAPARRAAGGPAAEVALQLTEPDAAGTARARYVRIAGTIRVPARRERAALTFVVEVAGRTVAEAPLAAGAAGFGLVADLGQLPAGAHRLEVRVLDEAGSPAARAAATVVLDRDEAWARVRRVSRPLALGEDLPSVLVVPVGEARDDPPRVARAFPDGVCARLEVPPRSGLPAALRAFLAADEDLAVLVEEPGAILPGALTEIAAAARRHGAPDAIYGDEVWPGAPPPLPRVDLRPAWSPELLLTRPYTGPLLGVGRAAAAAALERPVPPETLHELLLGLDPALARVVHVCRALFERPRWERALVRAAGGRPGHPPPARHGMSVVVCSAHGSPELLGRCLRGLAGDHGGGPVEVVLVDPPGAGRADALARCARLGLPARAVDAPDPFNFSVACNAGAAAAAGDELLFLNDDVEPAAAGWLGAMRRWLHRPGVGIVGARLRYPDGRLQHAGVVVGPVRVDNLAGGFPGDAEGPAGALCVPRNTTAVTAACMLVDRTLFDSIGGFDPALELEFGDVDLPLRAARAGSRTVLVPEAVLVHAEGATRGREGRRDDWHLLQRRWRSVFAAGDPFMHPALDPVHDFEPCVPPADAPRSREAPWSRGGCGVARRAVERLEGVERGWEAREVPVAADAESEGALAALRAEAGAAAAARDANWQALEKIRRSRSWRATRVLRAVSARSRTRAG